MTAGRAGPWNGEAFRNGFRGGDGSLPDHAVGRQVPAVPAQLLGNDSRPLRIRRLEALAGVNPGDVGQHVRRHERAEM